MGVGKFLGGLFGTAASAANPVAPAAAIVDGAAKIIGMFKLSPEVKAQIQAQLTLANIDLEKAELVGQISEIQGQLEINKAEASSASTWVSGWRPYIGWICGTALAWEFVLKPFINTLMIIFHHPPMVPLPVLDTGTLIAGLLAPMLGLGGLRTYEKIQSAPGADKLQ